MTKCWDEQMMLMQLSSQLQTPCLKRTLNPSQRHQNKKKDNQFDLQSSINKNDYRVITPTKGNKKRIRFATPSPSSNDQQSDQEHLPAKKEKYLKDQHSMNGLDH